MAGKMQKTQRNPGSIPIARGDANFVVETPDGVNRMFDGDGADVRSSAYNAKDWAGGMSTGAFPDNKEGAEYACVPKTPGVKY